MTRLAFVDTETTGLDPARHEVWEVAAIVVDDDGSVEDRVWQLPVDLSKADPIALEIGKFRERYELNDEERRSGYRERSVTDRTRVEIVRAFVDEFANLTHNAHLVGAVVSFDAERLARLLRSNGQVPTWHYHLVDVEALVAGRLRVPPPWSSRDLSLAVGIDPDDYERHTALGDAEWARDLYYAAMMET